MDPRTAHLAPRGNLTVRRIPAPPARPLIRTVADAVRYGSPRLLTGGRRAGLTARLRKARWQLDNADTFRRSLDDQEAFQQGRLYAIGHLWGTHLDRDGVPTDLGLMSCRVVTDAGVAFLVDALQGLVEPELMRYHGLGTGTTAESASQTALVNELSTAYAASNTRPTGTLGEKSGDAKTFETSATITVSSSVAATEHGLFTQASRPGGVMLDRSVFSVVNLVAGEALQVTYQLTLPSGG